MAESESVFDEPIYLGGGTYWAAPTVVLCTTYGSAYRVFRVPLGATRDEMRRIFDERSAIVCTPPIPWDARDSAGWTRWDGTGSGDLRWVVVWLRWWLALPLRRRRDAQEPTTLAKIVCARINRACWIRRQFEDREAADERPRIAVFHKTRAVMRAVKEIRTYNAEQKKNRKAS